MGRPTPLAAMLLACTEVCRASALYCCVHPEQKPWSVSEVPVPVGRSQSSAAGLSLPAESSPAPRDSEWWCILLWHQSSHGFTHVVFMMKGTLLLLLLLLHLPRSDSLKTRAGFQALTVERDNSTLPMKANPPEWAHGKIWSNLSVWALFINTATRGLGSLALLHRWKSVKAAVYISSFLM